MSYRIEEWNQSEETGRSADSVGQIGGELLKVADVEGVDGSQAACLTHARWSAT